MGPIDFTPVVRLAVVGAVVVLLALVALPFVAVWFYRHVAIVIQ